MNKFYNFFICFICHFSFAQLNLKPSIGLSELPSANDSVCSYPVYPDPIFDTNGNFENCGYLVGDTVPQFKLYTLSGDSMDLQLELEKGKPVLLIAASYTCPVFRGLIGDINSLVSNYSSTLSIYLVYVIEAHPDTDISPYSGTVWTHSDNYAENILYRQPTTYGERTQIVSDMITNYTTIDAPILIDGPCNEWWLNFGPAPNIAYLIDTNGIVYSHHGWFNKAPHNMATDIESLVGTSKIVNGTTFLHQNTIYFQPNLNRLTFSFDYPASNFYVKLIDLNGKLSYNGNLSACNYIDVACLGNGLYFCEVLDKNKSLIREKVVINR